MIIIKDTIEFQIEERSAIAIGKFDGIHLGHRKLLEHILDQKKNGLLATVFTFDMSAATFFGGDVQELSTREEKRRIFEEMGIDILIEFPLNRETAATEPEEFIRRYLVSQMKAAYICAGKDLSFGKKGAGNYEMLESFAKEYAYQVEIIDKVKYNGRDVSSTLVRQAVREGDMESVTAMLGMAYRVNGIVVHGNELGRTIGMPTANIIPPETKLLPPFGVYYSQTEYDGKRYRSISNIGCKPTVSEKQSVGVETYLYDFDGDLYSRPIQVELLAFRRPEMKFDDFNQLKNQMHEDLRAGAIFEPESQITK